MPSRAKRKPERISPLLMVLVLALVVIPLTICRFFFFGIYRAIGCASCLGVLIVFSRFWARRHHPSEIDSSIDKAINKANDDPRKMARWVP